MKEKTDNDITYKGDISLELARRLSERVEQEYENGSMLNKVSSVTRDLLLFWFDPSEELDRKRSFNYQQRQTILNIIYLHEIVKINTVFDIYKFVLPDILHLLDTNTISNYRYSFPKYAVKTDTEKGKTLVINALVIWQLLNADYEESKTSRYTKNFIITTSNLVDYDKFLTSYKGKKRKSKSKSYNFFIKLFRRTNDIRDFRKSDFLKLEGLLVPPIYRETVLDFVRKNASSGVSASMRKIDKGFISVVNWYFFDDHNKVHENLLKLPSLMIINYESHHAKEYENGSKVLEADCQKSIDYVSQNKSEGFFQIDFSSIPYNIVNSEKVYFPYIIADYASMRKSSNADVRLFNDQELQYKEFKKRSHKKDELNQVQRLLLYSALNRLNTQIRLSNEARESKYYKMLVSCENVKIVNLVEEFLVKEESLGSGDVLKIETLEGVDLEALKERILNLDKVDKPKFVVMVRSLTKHFDFSNIAVVVR